MNQGRALFRVGLKVTTITASVLFAAPGERATVCANCHPKEAAAYLKSPMGNSIAPPSALAGGRITRKPSGDEISIGEREGIPTWSGSAATCSNRPHPGTGSMVGTPRPAIKTSRASISIGRSTPLACLATRITASSWGATPGAFPVWRCSRLAAIAATDRGTITSNSHRRGTS